jgi:hypothetical protein
LSPGRQQGAGPIHDAVTVAQQGWKWSIGCERRHARRRDDGVRVSKAPATTCAALAAARRIDRQRLCRFGADVIVVPSADRLGVVRWRTER